MSDFYQIAHEALCAILLWGVFCRFTKSDSHTFLPIRLAFWLLGISSCFGMVAPMYMGYQPNGVEVLLLASFAAVQVATAHVWRKGVPYRYVAPDFRPKRRYDDTVPQ